MMSSSPTTNDAYDVHHDDDDGDQSSDSGSSGDGCSSSEISDGESSSGGDSSSEDGDRMPINDDGGLHEDADVGSPRYFHPNDEADYYDEMEMRTGKRRRSLIILALSTLLTVLLLNFCYQLSLIMRAENNDDDGVDTESSVDPPPNKRPLHETEQQRQKDSINNKNKLQDLPDDPHYQLPRHAARIYTHAALSSKNYRAGGVLSDDMLDRYESDGVLVIRNLVSRKLLDRLDAASRMLLENDNDGGSSGRKKKKRGKQFHTVKNGAIFLGVPLPAKRGDDTATCTADASDGDGTCRGDGAAEGGGGEQRPDDEDDNIILSSFRDLAMYSKVPRVAASLLRLDELRAGGGGNLNLSRQQKANGPAVQEDDSVNLRICRDIFLTKDDDPYACGWHVDDAGFWPSVAADPGINAWVALDDMPWPGGAARGRRPAGSEDAAPPSTEDGDDADGRNKDKPISPVATFALSLGSHRAPWRHRAYEVTGSTHTMPPEGYKSAADLIRRRTGSGTCNIRTSAPDLYEKLEEHKVIYDLRRGDVIFHHRWVFHRTVTAGEYDEMAHPGRKAGTSEGDARQSSSSSSGSGRIFRRYSVRYAPGTATVPPGFGVEPSVLDDPAHAGRTLDDVVGRSGLPWYPKVWPHARKEKPLRTSSSGTGSRGGGGGSEYVEEEIEGLGELVHEKLPKAEEEQRKRKREISKLLAMRAG